MVRIPLIVAAFLCALVLVPQAQERQEMLRIAAVVYDELIFVNDVDQALQVANPTVDFANMSQDRLFQERMRMLGLLIDERLQVRAVERLMTPQQRAEAERTADLRTEELVSNLKNQFRTPAAMEQWQRQQGITLEQYERIQRRRLYRSYLRSSMAQRLKQEEIPAPTSQDLTEYRESNPDYLSREQIRIAHILLRVPEDASPAEEADILLTANQVSDRARTGENFSALVQEYSEDTQTAPNSGVLPMIERSMIENGEIFEEFDVLFDLDEGTITDPIRTRSGYHVVLVLQKESLQDMVVREKLQSIMNDWTQELRSQASEHIEVRLSPDGIDSRSE